MKLDEYVLRQKEEMLEFLSGAIRIPSVRGAAEEGAPFGREPQRCLAYVLEAAEKLGFRTCNVDNYMGWCEYGAGDEMIAVLAHLDVVPAGDGWHGDPFSGEIRDGNIYGRGTMDDKGPAAAALFALKALKESGLPLRRRIRILLGTNEETGSDDMKYYLAHGGEVPVCGFTPDGEYPLVNGEKGLINARFSVKFSGADDVGGAGEPADPCASGAAGASADPGKTGESVLRKLEGGDALNVVPAHASAELALTEEAAAKVREFLAQPASTAGTGSAGEPASSAGTGSAGELEAVLDGNVLTVKARGISAHASHPEEGDNAIGRLLIFLCGLPVGGNWKGAVRFLAEKIGMEHDGTSLGIRVSDDVSGPMTVNLGEISGDAEGLRCGINYRYPVTLDGEPFRQRVNGLFAENGFIPDSETHKKALYVPEDTDYIQKLLKVYRDRTGDMSSPKSIGGGTYAKSVPNIVAFGPIFPGDAVREHLPDEYWEIGRLMLNAEIIADALYALAGEES